MAVLIHRIRTGVTNSYVIRDRGTILVDTGEPGRGAAVLARLEAFAVRLRDVSLIVITHGHFDHAGNADLLRRVTGAPVVVHKGDAGWLARGDLMVPDGLTPWGRALSFLGRRLIPRLVTVRPVAPDVILDDEGLSLEAYGIAGRIVHTPGHTPGSVTVLVGQRDAIAGDLAMNGPPFCLRPSLAVMGDDPAVMRRSWLQLGQLGARTVHPGHGRPFPFDDLSVRARRRTAE
jgi:glyoxylase-like metal-dependent hydrolase (beta-lactamase superfamily II)